ncbi:MAG: CAP domain-containing protein [Clostridiales bacterium]|nr:CAP domain-containing protein [Clostridiales bacterium]
MKKKIALVLMFLIFIAIGAGAVIMINKSSESSDDNKLSATPGLTGEINGGKEEGNNITPPAGIADNVSDVTPVPGDEDKNAAPTSAVNEVTPADDDNKPGEENPSGEPTGGNGTEPTPAVTKAPTDEPSATSGPADALTEGVTVTPVKTSTPTPTKKATVTPVKTSTPTPTKKATVTPVKTSTPTPKPAITNGPASMRDEVIRLCNVEREKAGLSPLKAYSPLSSAAQVRAVETITLFAHQRPDGTSCYTALDGINYMCAGENIAAGYRSAKAVVDGWMNSPGHRANILNSDFTEIGVGLVIAPGSEYIYYWSQFFIGGR